jgi:hypothetical protein
VSHAHVTSACFNCFLFSVLCCIHVASVLRCSAVNKSEAVWIGALGPGEWGCCVSRHAGAYSSSSAHPEPECHPRRESERERAGVKGRTGEHRDRGGVHSLAQGEGGRGGLYWCPNLWTLATPQF